MAPKSWRRAGVIFTPKERDSTNLGQFRPAYLLNAEDKNFFSLEVFRQSGENKNLVDASIKKPGFSIFSRFFLTYKHYVGSNLISKNVKWRSAGGFSRFSQRFWLSATQFTAGKLWSILKRQAHEWVGEGIFLRHSVVFEYV